MRKVLRKQKSAYAFSLVLFLAGIMAFAVTLWETYPKLAASQDPFSTFMTLVWQESVDFVGLTEIKLIYLVLFGDVALVLGLILWFLSRQWLIVPEKITWYECPYCKKRWKAVGDKALVHCPHCRQLIHPRIAEGKNL